MRGQGPGFRVRSPGVKVVIAGGGTGGHLYPGIAIARELLQEAGTEILFVGTQHGIEARVLPKEGLPLRCITVGKLKGMGPLAIIKTVAALPWSILQSMRILREIRPDVVIGVGGYSSGPVGAAALGLRIPLVIIEPNSFAGFANRKLGRYADRVVLCFPGTGARRFFPGKSIAMLGPLVRRGIDQGDRSTALAGFGLEQGRFTVFVMGGSGGAHAINMAMKQAALLLKDLRNVQILHQTGENDVDEMIAGYTDAGVRAAVLPFIHDMAGAYAAADLVISRSGATTVAELAVCNKRAVLIPFPYAADNHQEHNARTLAERGSADVIVQKDLTPDLLARAIRKQVSSGTGASSAAPMENSAATEIARICKTYVQKN